MYLLAIAGVLASYAVLSIVIFLVDCYHFQMSLNNKE
jgi:hypothetical protein